MAPFHTLCAANFRQLTLITTTPSTFSASSASFASYTFFAFFTILSTFNHLCSAIYKSLLKVKQLYILLLTSFSLVLTVHAQDTIKVQTFTWADTHRADTFNFPDNPTLTFRKILMKYNMRCHDAVVGNGNTGCYRWDYSCNTFITDPTRTDSTKATAPDYTISNFNDVSFPYSHTPTYVYTAYTQHETTLQAGSNTNEAFFNGQGLNTAYAPAAKTYRYQVILPAADLIAGGMNASRAVHAMRMTILQPGSVVGFFKIRLKNTTQLVAGDHPDETDLQEVYHKSTAFTGSDIVLPFYTSFDWSGDNLLVDISFTTGDPTGVPAFAFYNSPSADLAIQSETAAAENNLFFGGAGSIDLQKSSVQNIKDEITVSFWAYGDPALLPANTQVFDATDSAGRRQANVHLPWSSSEVYWDCGNDGSGYDRISTAVSAADFEGKWSHWAFTKNTTTGIMNIFLNGQLFLSGTGNTKKMDFNSFRFGMGLDNTNPWFGAIDEIQVWDKALDEATIRNWMFKQVDASHPEYAHLRSYFKLNEGAGNIATDASANHIDAALSIPTWRVVRGNQRFHNFAPTNLLPKVSFLQGNYTIHDQSLTVLDSVVSPLHQVIHFGLVGSDLVRLDTQYVYPAGDRPVFDESGLEIDAIEVPSDGIITIQTLTYYIKQQARFELLSLVTPYGIGLDLGPEGKTFTFDVTDFAPILKGKKRLSVEFGGENQEELDIQFLFITGTPERDVLNIQPIWPEGRGYFSEILSDARFEPRQVPLMASASFFKIRSAITGHEQNGEFMPRQHFININGGAKEFLFDVWKSCSSNPIYPQGGTWPLDRAGWCPGMATDVHSFALDGLVQPGQTVLIDYGVNSTPLASANYLVNNLLVSYGAFHFQVDASIEAIVRPNAEQVEFARLNPACNAPTVRVKNSGAQNIQSIKIGYSTSPGNMQTYTWTGNIVKQDMVDIALPAPPPGFWQAGTLFKATILEVNGAADGNSDNNISQIKFEPVAVYNYVDPIQLRVATNGTGADYSYKIKDGSGAVVLERNNMASNTVYTDDLIFPTGCYSLDFKDAGGDGLSFWFYPENGSGSLRIDRKHGAGSPIPLYSFDPDFGSGVQYDFHIGALVSATEETEQPFQLFSTYPNPLMDELKIDLLGFEGKELTFRLVDINGKTMVANKFRSESGNETTEIDLSKLAPGMYFLHSTDGKRNWVREVVKTN